jgi:hypothetical protein
LVREPRPSETAVVPDVRIEVVGGELAGQVFATDDKGRFVLAPVKSGNFVLEFKKEGYRSARAEVALVPAPDMTIELTPEPREIVVSRSGSNACTDLPPPPEGVPGLREYARIAVHHDGTLVVRSVQLPFFSNEGYVYRLTPSGWAKNEVDYILVRSPIPLLGGFIYSMTFGGGKELCGHWSLDATHPR